MRLAMLVSALAVSLGPLDVSIVNVALPTLTSVFKVDPGEIAAISLSYMLSLTGLLLVAGRLSDRFGAEKTLKSGYWIFIIGSALCGLAPTLGWLTFFRFIQGCGGALLFATSAVIIVYYTPVERRGRAYALNGLLTVTAIAIGAPLGGFLVEYVGWRWIFLINVPFGLAALFLAHISFAGRTPSAVIDLDLPGAVCSFLSLLGFIYGLHTGQDYGWGSPRVMAFLFLGFIFFILFLIRESRFHEPLLSLDVFRIYPLTAIMTGNGLSLALSTGLTFVLPFYLQWVKRLNADQVGMILMISPVLSMLFTSLAGYLSDRFGTRPLCIASISALFLSAAGFTTLNADSSYTAIFFMLALLGLGRAFFIPAALTMTMSYAQTVQSGMLSAAKALLLNLGLTFGLSISALLYNLPINNIKSNSDATVKHIVIDIVTGFHYVTLFGVLVAGLGLLATFFSYPYKAKNLHE